MPPKRVVLEEPLPRRSGSAVSLACTAEDSNPRTTLLWYRGSGEPILDAGVYVVIHIYQRGERGSSALDNKYCTGNTAYLGAYNVIQLLS